MGESLRLGVDPAVPRERADLPDLVAAARRLVDDAGSEALRREWRRLQARLNEPHFSVAVVGEFSRGKSTLINRLLDAEILPVGAIPTTALLTRLRYAPEPSVQGVRRDGSRERLDAAPESWQRMLEGAEEPPWVTLQYGAPNEWLHVSGIQLFDTPGAGDLESSRMEEVIDAISVSDATLVAIDARMPLSLTEKAFIEQHLLERRVPHIVAVLTHLDEIQPANRAAVTRHVQDRLGALHPEIVFACAHDGAVLPSEVEIGAAGAEAIRAILSQWAAEPEHRELVRRQLFLNLERLLALVESELGARRAAAAMDTKERRRQLEEERFRFDHSRLDWEDLRLALRERCDAAVE
ncbi:MAG TPA: dynamin family protein, partial [Thermoanaerobaculia bacterium]|nr:dynamin family protein [Thermoanaerobaculia bacterium]